MKHIYTVFLLLVCFVMLTVSAWGQDALGDFRSLTTATVWNVNTTWEYYDGATWAAAASGVYPGATSYTTGKVTIQSGHSVTWSAASTSCGPVIVANGATLIHNASAGTYASLTVNGSLKLGSTSTSNKGMTITGNLSVGSLGSISCNAGTVAGNKHTVTVGGNLENNGSITATAVSTIYTTKTLFVFSKSGTASIFSSGSPTSTAFGNLTVNSGTVLDIQTPITIGGSTVSVVVVNGSITKSGSGTITYGTLNSTNSLTYSGTTGQQTTGPELNVSSIPSLTVNNANGIQLGSNAILTGTLTLTSGNITTGANTLTANTVTRTSGYIIGSHKKSSITGTQTFAVGTANGYTPVTATLTGTDDFTVKSVAGKHPNATGTNALGMYWTLTAGAGITAADLSFQYLAGDVVGTESVYDLARWTGSAWETQSITIDDVNHIAAKTGVTSFSDWTVGETGALPVELQSFTAKSNRGNIELNWSTATEINNARFEIEKNAIGSWSKIGFVEGHGTTNAPQSYSFIDANLQSGKYSYRLKQIDRDGKFSYSSTVEVNVVGAPTVLALKDNYPNPFNPSTNIEFTFPQQGHATLSVYNLLGQKVAELFNDNVESGRVYQSKFDGSELSSGLYFSVLEFNGKKLTKKMMLMK